MISTIFNELIVQIVSDFFPKPKAPPGFTMSTTVHKPSPSFSFLLLISITVHKHKTNRHFLFLPFIPACLPANANTKLTGIFCSFLLSQPAFQQTQTQTQAKQSNYKNNRQQAEGIRRTSGPSNGPHSPCPPTIFQQSSNLKKLLHQNNSLTLLST